MIIADGVPIQACIKTDIAFQLPYFFMQGVNLLVDGFQFGGINDGGLLFLQFLDGLLGFGELLLGGFRRAHNADVTQKQRKNKLLPQKYNVADQKGW